MDERRRDLKDCEGQLNCAKLRSAEIPIFLVLTILRFFLTASRADHLRRRLNRGFDLGSTAGCPRS